MPQQGISHVLVEVGVELEGVVGRVEWDDDGVGKTERDETEELRNSGLHERSGKH